MGFFIKPNNKMTLKIAIDRFQMVWDFQQQRIRKALSYMTMMQHILVQS
jgi:hypothetical protein